MPRRCSRATAARAPCKLGFEDHQNRAERAVERTAPFAFVSYTLTVLWYVLHGQRTRAASLPMLPWYSHEVSVTFSDMLVTCGVPLGAIDFLIRVQRWTTCENVYAPSSTTLPRCIARPPPEAAAAADAADLGEATARSAKREDGWGGGNPCRFLPNSRLAFSMPDQGTSSNARRGANICPGHRSSSSGNRSARSAECVRIVSGQACRDRNARAASPFASVPGSSSFATTARSRKRSTATAPGPRASCGSSAAPSSIRGSTRSARPPSTPASTSAIASGARARSARAAI